MDVSGQHLHHKCAEDQSGIHNTLTLYSEWCLKMRWVKALSAVLSVRKALDE